MESAIASFNIVVLNFIKKERQHVKTHDFKCIKLVLASQIIVLRNGWTSLKYVFLTLAVKWQKENLWLHDTVHDACC